MSRPTFRILSTTFEISNTGLSPSLAKLPSLFFYLNGYHIQALTRSLATTCAISVDFFSSGYLDGSVLQVRFSAPMYSVQDTMLIHGGFPHSDIAGSLLYCQLPHAFRRLTRPSSPIIAKAST